MLEAPPPEGNHNKIDPTGNDGKTAPITRTDDKKTRLPIIIIIFVSTMTVIIISVCIFVIIMKKRKRKLVNKIQSKMT